MAIVVVEEITHRGNWGTWSSRGRSEGGSSSARGWRSFTEAHASLKVLEPVPVSSTSGVDEGSTGSKLGVIVPATEVVCAGIKTGVNLEFANCILRNARFICRNLGLLANQTDIFTLFQRAESVAIATTPSKSELFTRLELSIVEELAEPANTGTPVFLK